MVVSASSTVGRGVGSTRSRCCETHKSIPVTMHDGGIRARSRMRHLRYGGSPMVVMKLGVHASSQNRRSRHDLPTPRRPPGIACAVEVTRDYIRRTVVSRNMAVRSTSASSHTRTHRGQPPDGHGIALSLALPSHNSISQPTHQSHRSTAA
jgi:hypothetical protein